MTFLGNESQEKNYVFLEYNAPTGIVASIQGYCKSGRMDDQMYIAKIAKEQTSTEVTK